MRKAVTFRLDPELLARARLQALADNRSLTNFIETAIRRILEDSSASGGGAGGKLVHDHAEWVEEASK